MFTKENSKRNPLLFKYSNYNMSHVGGNNDYTDNSSKYIEEQKKIIEKSNKRVPVSYIPPYDDMYISPYGLDVYTNPNFDSGGYGGGGNAKGTDENTIEMTEENRNRYDPYTDYLYKNGLIERKNFVRYNVYYLNIDSSLRNTLPTTITDEPNQLVGNPLSFMEFSTDEISITTQLKITHPGHRFQIGDNITLSGLLPSILILRTKNDAGNTPFIFTTGDDYMKIVFPGISRIDPAIYNGTFNGFPWTPADSDDLFIRIFGFRGSAANHPYIGNIPINTLNAFQQIYLTTPSNPIFDPNVIYIKLITTFDTGIPTQPQYVFLTSYNGEIQYRYAAGIPINLVNAEFPLNLFHVQGFLTIVNVEKDFYYVTINHRMGSFLSFGGNDIYVAKVLDVINGFTQPNHYILNLGKTYTNVIYVGIVDSEFPNTQQVVNTTNNVFYWENQDDGGHVYSVTLTPGNYDPISVAENLEKLILATPRVNYTSIGTQYTNKNVIKIVIDQSTSQFTASSYKEAKLQKPFINTIPSIPLTPSLSDPVNIQVQIRQINHNIDVGTSIVIKGAINTMGIPPETLNDTHIVTTVIDQNNYVISLSNVNLTDIRQDTRGGNNVTIFVPNIFRLIMDRSNCIGQLLGFRDVGMVTSITVYATTITNYEPYFEELDLDSNGTPKSFENNALSLFGDTYLLIQCPQLTQYDDIDVGRNINNIYGKILLPEYNGETEKGRYTNNKSKILFNTFSNSARIYLEPIPELYRLEFTFLTPNGNLFDFNYIDHSFTLKIVTVTDRPKGTEIDTSIGKIT